jgi:transketolase
VGDQGKVMSIERFGVSAPAKVIAEKFGFTVDNVVAVCKQMRGHATQRMTTGQL